MLPANRIGIVVACLAICLLDAGCSSESTTKVSGTVLRDGKPIPVSATGAIQLTLIPDVAAGEAFTTHPARCDQDGRFEIPNVKPGRYRVAVEQFDPNPQVDKLAGAFSAQKTTITRQIDGKKPLIIDLANPTAE